MVWETSIKTTYGRWHRGHPSQTANQHWVNVGCLLFIKPTQMNYVAHHWHHWGVSVEEHINIILKKKFNLFFFLTPKQLLGKNYWCGLESRGRRREA